MTFLAEEHAVEQKLATHKIAAFEEPVMALVDELGNETPITEVDIRRTLEGLQADALKARHENLDELMHRAEAARRIV